jgi:hypothetical protein
VNLVVQILELYLQNALIFHVLLPLIFQTNEPVERCVVLLLHNLAQKMRKQRMEHGAINFSSQEVRFKLDATG